MERTQQLRSAPTAGVARARLPGHALCVAELGYNVAQERNQTPANAVVGARIDEGVKTEAAAIYAAAGLTLSDAFRMLLIRTVADRRMPLDLFIPNAVTVDAMREAEEATLPRFASLAELMDDLNPGD